jgi:hypothetical protein
VQELKQLKPFNLVRMFRDQNVHHRAHRSPQVDSVLDKFSSVVLAFVVAMMSLEVSHKWQETVFHHQLSKGIELPYLCLNHQYLKLKTMGSVRALQ